MPYEISFRKKVDYADEDFYFNECCYGGEHFVDLLSHLVKEFTDIQSEQEDWGWFIWFNNGKSDPFSYAIDVFTDDIEKYEFRIHLTSNKKIKRLLWNSTIIEDSEYLESLKDRVSAVLTEYGVEHLVSVKLDKDHRRLESVV
ncbi:hypothetical protein L1F30_13395 [Simiduia sp. 21SJ11W-1]|uniref:hypothetical protein n=1 Tax=Simiduia sp. 21SJ11W-1 TaxID=2909669 RepID=UPI00209D1B7E|nr:hypothetical protein [Simiduia sp. 21SJ11W-1]UTA47152.1 hypothetical protein L1F30_13395 [Simiduia sp. 21SJ11W-1]